MASSYQSQRKNLLVRTTLLLFRFDSFTFLLSFYHIIGPLLCYFRTTPVYYLYLYLFLKFWMSLSPSSVVANHDLTSTNHSRLQILLSVHRPQSLNHLLSRYLSISYCPLLYLHLPPLSVYYHLNYVWVIQTLLTFKVLNRSPGNLNV